MASTGAVTKPVLLVFADGAAFLKAYRTFGDVGALYVRDRDDLVEGDLLELEIAFAKGAMVFNTQGKVIEHTGIRPGQSSKSALIQLGADKKLRDLMVAYAQGKRDPHLRKRLRRLPLCIPVDYTEDTEFRPGATEDLSREGAAIKAEGGIPEGPLVALRLRPPAGDALTINAEVCWRRHEPAGFGVRFLIADDSKRRRVAELVDSLARTHNESTDDD